MKLSSDRILTTHVGSLPRPQPMLDLIAAREAGRPVDEAVFEAHSAEAVSAIVAPSIVRAKFKALAEGARIASTRLWK